MKQVHQQTHDGIKRPFNMNAEFIGQALFPAIRALPNFVSRNLWQILADLGIHDPQDDQWYSAEVGVEFYQRVWKEYGPHTVYDLGKTIPEMAIFPPDIKTLYDALSTLHLSFEMNHRGGYMGFYRMVSHDEAQNTVIVQCYSPYPCDMDRGLLVGLGRKYANTVRVYVDDTKPSKQKGGHESWYIVKYT